ncbi:MAG: hypothetical protein ACI4SK_01040 [Christensenellales bacterium]
MNFVFTALLIISSVAVLFYSPDLLLNSLLAGGKEGLDFSLKLFAVYAVWMSILRIWKSMSFDSFLGKKLKPLLKKIFPGENDDCYNDLSVNLSANMLGMGSAGTPAGIAATEKMSIKKNRTMLIVINSSSVQIIPTTIIAMRSAIGATTDIILPSIIATFLSTLLGFLLVKFFVR